MSIFDNIPVEMRSRHQFVCWKYIDNGDGYKPTKVPIDAKSGKFASTTNPNDWSDFETAKAAAANYNGIGYVFTNDDPFVGVDCDNTQGDRELFSRQLTIFTRLASYSERSPSGNGLHIIVKAKLNGPGRKRNFVEIYDQGRFFTMTGDVYNNVPIADRQTELLEIYESIGTPAKTFSVIDDKEQKRSDDEILTAMFTASNGDKAQTLHLGNWQSFYPSQSEADFALVDIIAFYTRHRPQIKRVFRASGLGQRDKAQREDYLDFMVDKSYDRQLPPIDIEGLRIMWQKAEAAQNEKRERATEPNPLPPSTAPDKSALAAFKPNATFGPGLIGELAQFILEASPRPVPTIANFAAIGFLSGICGRAYNVSGTGLNQYMILVAETGRGKEAIAEGFDRITAAVMKTSACAAMATFKGPGEIASPQALIKWLANQNCVYSLVGEIGLKLREWTATSNNPHSVALYRQLLNLYAKSGHGRTFDPMAYSQKENNVGVINAPAFTLIGESTPLRFYENMTEETVADGLMPRFMIFEYDGPRVDDNEHAKFAVLSDELTLKVANLVAYCHSLSSTNRACEVAQTPEAEQLFREFDKWTTKQINNRAVTSTTHELWNRAHLKAKKLAALYAVGINYLSPTITKDLAQRATDEIVAQTLSLKKRFDDGETGGGGVAWASNEDKQLRMMIKAISEFLGKPWEDCAKKYRVTKECFEAGVFPYNSLLTRLQTHPVFSKDRMGSGFAVGRTFKQLTDNDDVREIAKNKMQTDYGKSCRAFCISNPARFLEA